MSSYTSSTLGKRNRVSEKTMETAKRVLAERDYTAKLELAEKDMDPNWKYWSEEIIFMDLTDIEDAPKPPATAYMGYHNVLNEDGTIDKVPYYGEREIIDLVSDDDESLVSISDIGESDSIIDVSDDDSVISDLSDYLIDDEGFISSFQFDFSIFDVDITEDIFDN